MSTGWEQYVAYRRMRYLWRCKMNLVLDGIAEATDRAERDSLEVIIAATKQAAGELDTEQAPGEEPRT